MSLPYIPLNRAFYPVSEKELDDVETLLALADSAFDLGSLNWDNILEYPRVLILAQGGVGKTREMQEQANKLNDSGQMAFFMPLERLDDDPIKEVLGFDDGDRFEAWLKHEDGLGWFFLDSVDELKTSQGTLERALRKFARALERDALRRARVVLSCRPKDWSETVDRPAVQSTLALPPSRSVDGNSEEDAFVASLKRDRKNGSGDAASEAKEELKVVMLLPLDRKRTRQFAEALSLPELDAFMDEVTRRNADELVKRPMDLVAVLGMWRKHRRLGTRLEQLNLNIRTNLTEAEESQHKRTALSLERAREGVKRIALGMVLAKRSSIYAEAPSVDRKESPTAISAEHLLDDWDEDERGRLLRLPIFDLAALGQVRFHHRSIKDYLAAERLCEFSQSNMSGRDLQRLLIAEKYGEPALIPSMRDVAAWLSLWDERLRAEILRISPQVLIAHGDPGALPVHEREALLSAFASAHGAGGWRGLGFDITQMRRLSDPSLGTVVRKIWREGHENEEVIDLLIDMIWHGPLPDCADLAESVTLDPERDNRTRATAVRALIACGQHASVQRFVDDALVKMITRNELTFRYLFAELVPKYLPIDRFVGVLRDIFSKGSPRSDFNWELNQVVEKLPPHSSDAGELRDGLTRLIEEGVHDGIEEYKITSVFGKLVEPLALLCARQIEAGAGPAACLVHASVIASRFENDGYSRSHEIEPLVEAVQKRVDFREAVYWEDVALLDHLFPDRGSRWRAWRSSSERALIAPLVSNDAVWLENALASADAEKRSLALHLLLDIWRDTGRPDGLLGRVRSAAANSRELTAIIHNALEPVEEPPRFKESKERLARRQQAGRAKEHLRISDWKDWREFVCATPLRSFSGHEEEANVINLIKWVAMHEGRDVSDGPWNSDAVISMLGAEVFRNALPALKRYWRKHKPLLWSERAPEERSTFLWAWMYGLCSLKAEVSEMGWIDRLSDEEVRLATRYAMIQLNGQPEFLDLLIASRSNPVLDLLSSELEAQLHAWEQANGNLPLLQTIRYGGDAVQRLLAPTLMDLFERWPRNFDAVDSQQAVHGLSHLIDILSEVVIGIDAERLRSLAQKRFKDEPGGQFATLWLNAVFKLDFEAGVDLLTEQFRNPENPEEEQIVLSLLAGIFGDRGDTPISNFQSSSRADVLGRLSRFSYKFVKREKDRVHDGVFTSDTRDHAVSARNAILSALINTPGADARRVLLELANDPQFASIADRWRMLSLEQLAIQAEFDPYDIDAIKDFERQYELAPRTSEELLSVVVGRLDDLAHDIHHHKFSRREEWLGIEDEADAQRRLAAQLDERRAQAYTAVTREEEVAEENRTDITLSTLGVDAKQATIEIKIANRNRTAVTLAHDIKEQLVGKYLRHDVCRAGCFLVVNRGDKTRWKHPETKKMVSFSGLIEYLEGEAREIEERHAYRIKLSVFGFDLTEDGTKRHTFNVTHGGS